MAFWGFSFVWVKIVYYYYQPITTVFLRVTLAAIILYLIKLIFKIGIKPDKKDIKFLFLMAFFEPFAYFLGESFGMQYVSSTLASVIISTIPVITPLAAFLIVKEKISLISMLGIIISFTGILVMVLEPDFTLKESPKGIALMFLAVFAAIIYTIMIKKLSSKYKPITILLWQYFFGALLFLPLFLIYDFQSYILVKPDFRLISTLLALVVFASLLAFFFFITVIDKLGINKTNVFTNFVPIVTVVAAYFILPEENINAKVVVGMMIAIIGIFVAQIKRKTINRKKINYDKS